MYQIRDETADRKAGVTKALRELYEVVTHEFLEPTLRYAMRIITVLIGERYPFHTSTLFPNTNVSSLAAGNNLTPGNYC